MKDDDVVVMLVALSIWTVFMSLFGGLISESSKWPFILLFLLATIYLNGLAQIETTVYDPSAKISEQKAIFFTNRPIIIREDSSVTFKNKFTDKGVIF